MYKLLFTLLLNSILLIAAATNNVSTTNIISFSALLVKHTGNLTWQVIPQQNIIRYEVEKSNNGIDYSYVSATIATNHVAIYTATDKNVLAGNNYYRLKIVLQNGTEQYSNSIVLNNSPKAVVAPSIVSNSLHIWVPAHTFIHTAIIKNTLGNICVSQHQLINNLNMASIDIQKLQKGCYTIQIFYNSGEVNTLSFSKK